jgi:cyclase
MLRTRIIPTLLLADASLIKTKQFGKFTYVGDPANTVRIFNELEVDELIFLDITASRDNRPPNYKVLRDIADECFMPLVYGGGIDSLDKAKAIFDIGFEKVAVNTHAGSNPTLVTQLATQFGSQSVVASIDVKANLYGKKYVHFLGGRRNSRLHPVDCAMRLESLGAGEILLTSIDREGTWQGFDTQLTKEVSDAVSVPVIAHGGAGSVDHIWQVVHEFGASAVAVGSMVVFQKKGMGVLVLVDRHISVVRFM